MLKVAYLEKYFVICTDASKEGVDRVFTQVGKVIAYESHKLKEYEQCYSAYDLELTAVVHALKVWQHYLLGKKFLLWTDHSSLTNFFNQSSLNDWQAKWTTFLSDFDFDMKHLKGK